MADITDVAKIVIRPLREPELQLLEWEGAYTQFRRVYRQTFEDALRGQRLMLVAVQAQRPLLDRYLSEWRFVRAALTGDDLLALGLPAGPRFKTLLWELRAGRLDGTLTSRAAELAHAQQWLNTQAG